FIALACLLYSVCNLTALALFAPCDCATCSYCFSSSFKLEVPTLIDLSRSFILALYEDALFSPYLKLLLDNFKLEFKDLNSRFILASVLLTPMSRMDR